ncbi:MAG: tRNA pseudouridine(38-40) synthase TruA [Candidatus Omnitrophica bacterium]|nr:tRNA pseudouridine(38-40) synthase TruA [Candidatus Omnitrophota bacterium]MCM8777548.1 tRNA pseudouridine(38-40) synthase TruA [Candidatus Omnitrophota bacterium]
MKEKNVKLVIAYNGSRFYGWQRQKKEKSVQETIEKVLKKITGEDIKLIGCGRTDSKVHAISYTANFKTVSRLTADQIKKALNANLPYDIYVKSAEIVETKFHSRYNTRKKRYRYLIICEERSPFLENFACFIKDKLDIEKMRKAAVYFKGRHNFSAFQAKGSRIKDTIRTIYSIIIKEEKFILDPEVQLISIEITADGFLYKMARNIIGTLIYIGLGKLSPEDIPEIIASGDRKRVPPTAPPEGLYLKKVVY